MKISFSKSIYPKIALLKAAYAFTDRAYLHLDVNEKNYIVEITSKIENPEITQHEFENEILCQTLRHEIYEQTKNIRELLLARAVASTVIEQSDATELYTSEINNDDKEILTDWFEVNRDFEAK